MELCIYVYYACACTHLGLYVLILVLCNLSMHVITDWVDYIALIYEHECDYA